VPDSLCLEESSHLDGPGNTEPAVRVDELVDAVAKSTRDHGHDLLRAPGPLVDIAPALSAHPPLEGVEALVVTHAHESGGLICRSDVSLHR